MQRLRAVVQSRDRLVRELLAEWLEQRARIVVVALAASGEDLAAAARAHEAQLLVLEVDAIGSDPAEVFGRLALCTRPGGARPSTIGIHRTLSSYALRRLREAGYDRLVDYSGGLVSLWGAVTQLCDVLTANAEAGLVAAAAGGVGVGAASSVVSVSGAGDGAGARGGEGRLTTRELAVLQLLCLGGGSREIAAALDVTANTVESHKRRIFAKLEVRSRIQAILRAEDLGLVRDCRPDPGTGPESWAPPMLTPREREVLALLGAGHTVKQTAHRLGIADKTVESVQRHLFGKLGVHDRVGALAAVYGRTPPPPRHQDP